MEFRRIEETKIEYARKLFTRITSEQVEFGVLRQADGACAAVNEISGVAVPDLSKTRKTYGIFVKGCKVHPYTRSQSRTDIVRKWYGYGTDTVRKSYGNFNSAVLLS